MYDATVACLEGKEMLLVSWHTLVASSVTFTSMLVNSSVGVISYNLYWNHTLTIHFIVTFVMLFLHWASIRLKFLGWFGAVWIKTENKVSISIMYVVFQCKHSYIQVHVVTLVTIYQKSLIHSNYCITLMPLPWQPVTNKVKLRFWSVLHIFAEWEHPISVPLSSVLILDNTSLEVKASELLAATSVVPFTQLRILGVVWFLPMVMHRRHEVSAAPILLLVHQSTLHWTEQ